MGIVEDLDVSPTCTFDGERAAELRDSLSSVATSAALAQDAVRHVLAERAALAGEPGTDARRVALDTVRQPGGSDVFIARGELLLSGPAAASVRPLLGRLGFEVLAELGPLVRLRRPTATASEVMTLCRSLRELGVNAAPNHVTMAGKAIRKGVMGRGAARPTSVDPGARAHADRRGCGVTVAVVDTGIDPAAVAAGHGWLDGVAVHGGPGGNVDLLDSVPVPDGSLDDGAGHGTFVAGIVRQLAPACDIVMSRALASDGVGTEYALAECLFELAAGDRQIDVVNMSMACEPVDDMTALAVEAGLEALFDRNPDVIVVAAAGNDGASVPAWPAAHKNVIAVGAVDGERAVEYSNRGYWVDYSVPADGVVSTFVRGNRTASEAAPAATFDGDYAAWSGTSFAAPQLAGMLAELLAAGHSASSARHEMRRRTVPTGGGVGRTFPVPPGVVAAG